MNEFKFTLRSLEDSFSFEVTSEQEEDIERFILSFFALFPEVNIQTKQINCLQRNSLDLRDRINVFADFHQAKNPKLKAIAAFFNKLPDDEPFYFIPFMELTLEESISLNNYLTALKSHDKDFNILQQQTKELFGGLLNQYKVMAFGRERRLIGEKEKSKRVCRFCRNIRPVIAFNRKAHAISEAIGNKTIILLEECDDCNEHFSKSFEPDFVEFHSLLRTIYKVKGKGGIKNYTGKNFKLTNTDSLTLKFESDDGGLEPFLPMTVHLDGNQNISLQNIYKTLCKYFLSVIPAEYLGDFEKTVLWLNSELKMDSLPKIASLVSFGNHSSQPELVTFIRKTDNIELPYAVGELRFLTYRYVFIVPGSNRDQYCFLSEKEYDTFWKEFKHYGKIQGWMFKDFSADRKRPFSMKLNFL